jgi:hypothetical protein
LDLGEKEGRGEWNTEAEAISQTQREQRERDVRCADVSGGAFGLWSLYKKCLNSHVFHVPIDDYAFYDDNIYMFGISSQLVPAL